MVAAPQQMRRYLHLGGMVAQGFDRRAGGDARRRQAGTRFVASIVARPAELHDVAVGGSGLSARTDPHAIGQTDHLQRARPVRRRM